MHALAENVRIMRFPLALLGFVRIGRTVTLIRLRSGEVVIHSTAPFTRADVETISNLGNVAALVDATLLHDTFAKSGQTAFPAVPYFAPAGFGERAGVPANSLETPPNSWNGELEILRLDGMPKVQEHVFFHPLSRTLIVADLVFNIGREAPASTRFMLRWATGMKRNPGVSRMFRMMIRDREAFARSIRHMMQLDFDRVITGHGKVIESGGKQAMAEALHAAGL